MCGTRLSGLLGRRGGRGEDGVVRTGLDFLDREWTVGYVCVLSGYKRDLVSFEGLN